MCGSVGVDTRWLKVWYCGVGMGGAGMWGRAVLVHGETLEGAVKCGGDQVAGCNGD